ncbi:MAG: VWA domain-containing protein [Planctomycetaceae bacterium]|jgi:uncharacterized protein YegL|nr:VWA domain-containing protein [Planctomycetaceae bacterium]
MDFRFRSIFGSSLFHLAAALFILWQCSAVRTPPSVPGERFAAGGIIIKTPNETANDSNSSEEAEANAEVIVSDSLPPALSGNGIAADLPLPDANPGGTGISSGTNATDTGNADAGGANSVRLFDTAGKGTRFFYVFDRSGSMNGLRMTKAKQELLQSIASLKETYQFNVLFYSGRSEIITWSSTAANGTGLVFATETAKQNVRHFISGIMPEGGTRHWEPLVEALRYRPEVIFFLTDGERQDDLTQPELNEIRKANRSKTQINVIQFGQESLTDLPSESLQNLAKQNDGQYQYIKIDN